MLEPNRWNTTEMNKPNINSSKNCPVIVSIELRPCFLNKCYPYDSFTIFFQVFSKSQVACPRVDWKAVVNNNFLPNTVYAEIHFVFAFLADVDGCEQLMDSLGLSGESTEARNEIAVTDLALLEQQFCQYHNRLFPQS